MMRMRKRKMMLSMIRLMMTIRLTRAAWCGTCPVTEDYLMKLTDARLFARQAYVFGSHRTYSGVNGSSGSNRCILTAW
jgi:hypothetical protein